MNDSQHQDLFTQGGVSDARRPAENNSGSTGDERPTALLVSFIFSLAAVQGFTINLMALLLRPLSERFDLTHLQEGNLQTAFQAGGIVALFISGYVTEALGAKKSGWLTILSVVVGALMLGLGTTYFHALAAAVVIGLGNFSILAVYSAVITEHFSQNRKRMFFWTTACFAGSAAVGNLAFGFLLEHYELHWKIIFVVFAVLISLWFFVLTRHAGKRLHVIDKRFGASDLSAESTQAQPLSQTIRQFVLNGIFNRVSQTIRQFVLNGIFNRGTFWMLGVLVLLDGIVGFGITTWTPRYFQVQYGVGDDVSGFLLALIAAGVFSGRLVMSFFMSERFSDLMVLGTCYGMGILMFVFILIIPDYRIGLLLTFFCGVFIGAQAPTMYSLCSAKFGARAATAIPLMDAIGMMGGVPAPTVLGGLADRLGLESALWLLAAVGVLFVALVFYWQATERLRVGTSSPPDPCESPEES